MDKYKCNVCGYIYDPTKGDPDNGIKPGTGFESLPDTWVCPECGAPTMELGYHHEHWLVCDNDHTTDLEPLDEGPDPDRQHDEAIERRLFGEERK